MKIQTKVLLYILIGLTSIEEVAHGENTNVSSTCATRFSGYRPKHIWLSYLNGETSKSRELSPTERIAGSIRSQKALSILEVLLQAPALTPKQNEQIYRSILTLLYYGLYQEARPHLIQWKIRYPQMFESAALMIFIAGIKHQLPMAIQLTLGSLSQQDLTLAKSLYPNMQNSAPNKSLDYLDSLALLVQKYPGLMSYRFNDYKTELRHWLLMELNKNPSLSAKYLKIMLPLFSGIPWSSVAR